MSRVPRPSSVSWRNPFSTRAGALIIAYECPDCGYFHIGHADLSQRLAREVRIPRCRVCENPIPPHRMLWVKPRETPPHYCSKACKKRARKLREANDTRLC